MKFSDTQPAMKINGVKIDPLSEIRNAGIVTNGSVFWVKQVADSDYTTFQDQVGADVVRNTVQAAIDLARDDRNDYVLVVPADANAVYTLGTALDINKDRVHVLGVGANRTTDSYSVTLRGFGTAAAGTPLDTEYVNVTAGGVEFGGIRVLGTVGTSDGGTVSNGMLRLGTGATGTAHDFYAHDAQFEFNMTTAHGTPAVLTSPGTVHGARFENVWFGNTADALETAHAGVIAAGNGNKRWKFSDCTFVHSAGSSADRFVTAGTGATDYMLFERCQFLNIGTVAMASGFVGSVTLGNPVLLFNCSGIGVTAFGTDPTVYASPNQSGTAGAGVHNPGIYLRGSAGITAA